MPSPARLLLVPRDESGCHENRGRDNRNREIHQIKAGKLGPSLYVREQDLLIYVAVTVRVVDRHQVQIPPIPGSIPGHPKLFRRFHCGTA